uniref:ATP synthase complex subunit 8 n=1 Tax=Flavoperla hatakeyamae TaxID=2810149 RepID=A0A890JI85_9NEOP|nr:ATP synthase F0 subunit 8 [Flavoperla hatakeyamae]QRH19541.1 ATP synthase F0 subunit 8 [Flavoperla hatakeyamae]
MPQMAPISWLALFILFSLILLLFNLLNFFSFIPNTPLSSESQKISQTPMSWKW